MWHDNFVACGAIVMPDLGGGNSGVNMRTGVNMGNGGSWRDVNTEYGNFTPL